jgi:hypothetical protein
VTRIRLVSVVVLATAVVLAVTVAARAADGSAGLSVTVDRAEIGTKLGQKFVFRSTITNRSSTAVSGLIAHLNVLSFRSSVYVDPEDWSSNRVRYLAPIPAGGSTTITWRMEAVNAGSFAVYVTVLSHQRVPTTGPTVTVAITERRTLNSGGILPLALGIPGLLGLLTLGFRLRRAGVLAPRRSSRSG